MASHNMNSTLASAQAYQRIGGNFGEQPGTTSFMRSLDMFPRLGRLFSEDLLDAKNRSFGIAIAGCSTGEEVYSYAAMCIGSRYADFYVHGYDLYEDRLARGRDGYYPDCWGGKKRIIADRRVPYGLFTLQRGPDGPEIRVSDQLREHTAFAAHDFSIAPFPERYDVIVATNVLYQDQVGGKSERDAKSPPKSEAGRYSRAGLQRFAHARAGRPRPRQQS